MAAHVDFGILRQLEVGHRRQRAVGLALMHARQARRACRGVSVKAVLGHAERREDPLLHDLAEPPAGDALDHLADPVDVRAVLPLVARDRTAAGVLIAALLAVITLGCP